MRDDSDQIHWQAQLDLPHVNRVMNTQAVLVYPTRNRPRASNLRESIKTNDTMTPGVGARSWAKRQKWLHYINSQDSGLRSES
jgi:hypothetical protein